MSSTPQFELRITTCARHQLNQLTRVERQFVEAHLSQLASYVATSHRPAGPEHHLTGARPPVVELRLWPFLVLYESAAAERALTVMHVLRLPGTRPPEDAKTAQRREPARTAAGTSLSAPASAR